MKCRRRPMAPKPPILQAEMAKYDESTRRRTGRSYSMASLSSAHQHAEEDITFHDQVGYWLYEPATGLILQTLAIRVGRSRLRQGTRRRMRASCRSAPKAP